MPNRIRQFLQSKQNLAIIVIFLLFYLFKTQFQNLIIFLIDQIWLEGKITEIYTYNYTGELIGCEEILQSKQVLGNKVNLFYRSMTSVFFIFSLVAYMFLFRRKKKKRGFQFTDWLLLVFFSFFLFDALRFYIADFKNMYEVVFQDRFMIYLALKYAIAIILAIVLFFKYFDFKTKIQCVVIGLPSAYFGIILWSYIGSNLMPVIIN